LRDKEKFNSRGRKPRREKEREELRKKRLRDKELLTLRS